jgi:hypothetical protein
VDYEKIRKGVKLLFKDNKMMYMKETLEFGIELLVPTCTNNEFRSCNRNYSIYNSISPVKVKLLSIVNIK